jgi:hypothetical protein
MPNKLLTRRNQNAEKSLIIYDLNIFQREYEVPDESLADPSEGTVWVYKEPWFIHIYDYNNNDMTEIGSPIELSQEEALALITNDPYFQDHEPDLWYGLEGFMFDKWAVMSDRLKSIFESLPKHKTEVSNA